MGPWRLELLRLWRTRRLIVLAATFLILGLGSPVLTYYLPELLKNAGNGVRITVPKQTPADGIAEFSGNVAQLGTLVVVVVAAASLAIDAHPALAAFYRTRVHRPALLVLPRYLTVIAASVATLAVGTFGAWYETKVLLGHVPFGALMGGLALEALWLCFVTSIVTLFTSAPAGCSASLEVRSPCCWRSVCSEICPRQHPGSRLGWRGVEQTSFNTLRAASGTRWSSRAWQPSPRSAWR